MAAARGFGSDVIAERGLCEMAAALGFGSVVTAERDSSEFPAARGLSQEPCGPRAAVKPRVCAAVRVESARTGDVTGEGDQSEPRPSATHRTPP
jgi:hypothetical protein